MICFAVGEVGAWFLRRRRRFRVQGDSMLPTLRPGDFVLIAPKRVPQVGEIVVCRHPTKKLVLLKRVGHKQASGLLDLASDNTDAGTDSRHFGPIELAAVLGVVTICLNNPRKVLGASGPTSEVTG